MFQNLSIYEIQKHQNSSVCCSECSLTKINQYNLYSICMKRPYNLIKFGTRRKNIELSRNQKGQSVKREFFDSILEKKLQCLLPEYRYIVQHSRTYNANEIPCQVKFHVFTYFLIFSKHNLETL